MRRGRWLIGLAVAVAAGVLAVARPAPLPALDWLVYDALVRSDRDPGLDRSMTAVVAIDEASLVENGQWPWPRDVVATLVERLHALGATAVAFDMLFAEPDRLNPGGDARLAGTLSQVPSVLGQALLFDEPTGPVGCHLGPLDLVERQRGSLPPHARFFEARNAVCPVPVLAQGAGATGFINATPDADGRLRRVPLLVRQNGDVYPSLALAAVQRVLGGDPIVLDARADGSIGLTLAGRTIGLDAYGRMMVRHDTESGRPAVIPVGDVLNSRVDAARIRDRLVFVGATALGLRDLVTTSRERALPGVVLHAALAETLLGAPGFERSELAPLFEVSAAVLLALAVSAVTRRFGVMAGVLCGVVLAITGWFVARDLLLRSGTFVSPFWGWLAIAGTLVVEGAASLASARRHVERERQRRTEAQRLIVQALTTLTETRDETTGRHVRRTQELTRILANALAHRPAFKASLDPARIALISTLAPLHDIGKVGVSDAVLRKPSALTPEELEEMRRHPEIGYDALLRAEALAGVHDDEVLAAAKEIVRTHHERWDGGGYPRGLKGEAIPVSARLVALVDTYDAIVVGRTYHPASPHEDAVQAIVADSGGHFDPAVVEAFLSVQDEFRNISAVSLP